MNKLNKILIGILIIFLTVTISTAVPITVVNKTLNISHTKAFDITDHDGYIFAGQRESYASTTRIDSSGNVFLEKNYDESNGSYFSDIELTPDNGYIIVGTSSYELHNDEDEWLSSGLIIKTDEDGNVMWKRYIQEKNYLSFKSVAQTLDNNYVVLGNIQDYNGNPQSLFVIKFDSEGNVIINKTLTNNSDLDYSSVIKQTLDGGYIITGSISDGLDGIIIKTDKNFNVVWTKQFKGIGHISSIQLSNDAYIITGYLENSYPNSKNSWIAKISKNGKLKWIKLISYGVYNEVNSIKKTKNGYILSGTFYEKIGEPNKGILIKTDKRGNIIWNIVPRNNSYNSLFDIIEPYKNEYTSFGYNYDRTTYEYETFFVKIKDIKSPNDY
jgi:hypothetical protein